MFMPRKKLLAVREKRGDNQISPESVVQTIQFLHTWTVLFYFVFICRANKLYALPPITTLQLVRVRRRR